MGLVSYLLGKEDASTGAIAALLALVGIVLPALLGTALRVLHTQIIAVRCIPQPPLAGWLSGHLRLLARNDYYRQVLAWANELGPVFRFRIFFRTNIVVSDPVLVQQVRDAGCAMQPRLLPAKRITCLVCTGCLRRRCIVSSHCNTGI